MIFGDVLLEMLHYNQEENKFKQLFVIQFHSLFVSGNSTRFTKDQIDGICKDIRYPNEFFIDIIFDEDKATTISTYEEDVAKWKNIISDFIMKSYKSNPNPVTAVNTSNVSHKINEDKLEVTTAVNSEDIEHKENEEKEEDVTIKHNTLNKAQEILNKFKESKETQQDDEEEEEDNDDDDIENYLKSLESKTK